MDVKALLGQALFDHRLILENEADQRLVIHLFKVRGPLCTPRCPGSHHLERHRVLDPVPKAAIAGLTDGGQGAGIAR